MAHPRMYSDNDPHLDDIRRICLALPETTEVEAWGRPTFRVAKKMFAIFTSGEGVYGLVFKPNADERPALLADERITVPPYFGPSGWLAIDLDRGTKWAEITELIHASYLRTAPRRLQSTVPLPTS